MDTRQAGMEQPNLAFYDEVVANPAPIAHGARAVRPPASMGMTIATLIVSLVCSLGLLVSGLAMANNGGGTSIVSAVVITIGGCVLAWFIWVLLAGAGRRSAQTNAWPPIGLIITALFGLATGYSLFSLLTSPVQAVNISMLVAGILGLAASITIFIRDTDLAERGSTDQNIHHTGAHSPHRLVDSDVHQDHLVARGHYPLPQRGSSADAELWDFTMDDTAEIRRARRGL